MNTKSILLACGISLLQVTTAGAEPTVDHKPLAIGALHEFGAIAKGIYEAGIGSTVEVTDDWIDHFGAFLTKEAVVNERLHLSGGLGGVFQFRKPEIAQAGFVGSQRKGFFIGPTKAEAVFHFGDLESPWLKLGTGMFGYKYNPQAYNLGEYLFRSGPYPLYTMTGGYVIVNSAAAGLQGFKANMQFGNLKTDVFLVTETGIAPLYDWSVAVVAGYSLADGLFDLGAGVNFKRAIQIRPSRTALKESNNAYFTYEGVTYSGNTDYYFNQAGFYDRIGDTASAKKFETMALTVSNVTSLPDTDASKPAMNYYTAAGTILMARATLDLKKLFESDLFGAEDLKLYTEAAVLGVENYPVFYEKIEERMPVMVGFNFPGFRFLDLFAIQASYMNSPWMNNTGQIARQNFNIPYFPASSDEVMSTTEYGDLSKKDNLKWSVLLSKKLSPNISLSAQIASDHLRVTSSRYYFGPQYDHNEVTAGSDHWYWMTQLSWGI